jgi:hypothetical protein
LKSEFSSKNPVIVGSGPSAAIVAEFLVSKGITPTIFDAHSDGSLDEDDRKKLQIYEMKSHLGSLDSYYQSKHSNLNYEEHLTVRQSFKFGGFSRVWGSTLAFFPNIGQWPKIIQPEPEDYLFTKNFLDWNSSSYYDPTVEFDTTYPQNYIDKINSLSGNYFAQKSVLGISSKGANKCVNLNVCLTGCPVDSIWFAGNPLNKLILQGKVKYIPDSFLHSIKRAAVQEMESGAEGAGNRNILLFRDPKGEFFEIKASQVFLGLGPIGTAALLIRSQLFENVKVRDTHTVYAGVFSPQKKNFESNNNLSKWWVKKTSHPVASMQIYSPDVRFADRLMRQIPKIFPFRKIFARFLSRHLHPMLIYFDMSISGTIELQSFNSEITVKGILSKESKKQIRQSLRQLMFEFLRIGLYLPIFVIKTGVPGSGFHSGAFLKFDQDVNEFGELYDFKGIHFVDSSTLPDIYPGSITPTVMLNAVRIARITLKRDY